MSTTARVRLAADTRRAQLVAAAADMIAEQGFHVFSIAALAERCALTRAGVLHHVGSKEQLLIDVLEEKERASAAAVADLLREHGVRDDRGVLDLLVRRNLAQPQLIRLFTVLAAESINPEHPAHGYFRDRLRRNAQRLAPVLTGFDRPGAEVAVEVLSYLDGLQVNWLRDPTIDLMAHWAAFADRLFAARR